MAGQQIRGQFRSKYDFVKVRVYLDHQRSASAEGQSSKLVGHMEKQNHYYVLSRFLISRFLMSTQVLESHAVRIALDLKKMLVDTDKVDLTQAELESLLFQLLSDYGYGQDTIGLYRMISTFHHRRIPLIVMIGGTGCVGKSTLATLLAERLNLPSVVCTDLINEILCTLPSTSSTEPCALFDNQSNIRGNCLQSSAENCWSKFDAECRRVEVAMQAFIDKTLTDGKSIIIEGMHITRRLIDYVSNRVTINCTDISCGGGGGGEGNNVETNCHRPAVFVPFLLTVDDDQVHESLIIDWLEARKQHAATRVDMARETALWKQQFDWIQSGLLQSFCTNSCDGETVRRMSNSGIMQSNSQDTLQIDEQMHKIILERMERALRFYC